MENITLTPQVMWRATTRYRPTSLAKTGLVAESKAFLLAYERLGDTSKAYAYLTDKGLPQRYRKSRQGIVDVLRARFTSWNPPTWVLDDLLEAARQDDPSFLQAMLLIHVARQDPTIGDFVQRVVYQAWLRGESVVDRSVVNRFFDSVINEHPEVNKWTNSTRDKLASNILTTLCNYGLLKAAHPRAAEKHIVEPVVPSLAVRHLVKLLRAEGVSWADIPGHSDWHLWLWDEQRVRRVLAAEGLEEDTL